ncbi:MAG: Ribose-5-phosphate isomerase [candidate division TA06 bacterium 32_111]|uniref:Ribose-5-phosphate isomerase n=2 Tax=Bacteria candidate phyla TaxID=1783234 RepID=A0A101I161_UNCT6|nr:MAG: Ribose-5-phosphate isomerase [candidate division TA06 bacterium 32_111]KUK86823.1 MAG: Ribose-5-phosphate isomerase [candidate division TA06 bacterium 34_109]HAF07339.1 ribose 5-phosphate isomerase B [candidate division WOR-3 bacterium]HCP17170.1 ribose 5-phosphate isomerase B [candidate division WOR-3 bacterium]
MKVSIGSDHRGFKVKEEIKKCSGFEFIDRGTFSEESTDYPDYAKLVADDVLQNRVDFGILICYSGIGMSIAANKIKGIRAAYVIDEEFASLAKKHNNANILVLGAKVVEGKDLCKIVKVFSAEQFEGGRHQKRIDKICSLEKN